MFDRIKQLFARWSGRDKVTRAYVDAWRTGLPAFTDPEEENALHQYIGDVYSCVSLRADATAGAKIQLYQVGGKVPRKTEARSVPKRTRQMLAKRASLQPWTRKARTEAMEDMVEILDHPLLDLLKKVNPYHNQFEFFEALSIYLDLLGKCHVYMATDTTLGRVVELWPLPPNKIRPVYSRETLVDHWLYKPGFEDIRYETDEIMWMRLFSPLDMLEGWGPLKACLRAADLSTRMLDYERALLKNSAVPDLLLTSERPMAKPETDRFHAMWNSRHGGDRVGGMGIVGGVSGVHQLGLSPKDLGHDKGMDRMRDRICNAFRVPKSMLTSDDVNRANGDAGLVQFARWAIAPKHRRMEQWLNQDLLPHFDDTGLLMLAFEEVIPEDREVRLLEIEKRIAAGYTSPNEERAHDGLPPREGGDEYRDPPDPMDQPFTNARPAPGTSGDRKSGGPPHSSSRSVRLERSGRIVEVISLGIPKMDDGPGEAPMARGMLTMLQKYFALQEADVLSRMQPGTKAPSLGGGPDVTKDDDEGRPRPIVPAPADPAAAQDVAAGMTFASEVWDDILRDRAIPFIRSAIREGAKGGARQLAALNVVFDLSQAEALEFMERRTIRFSGRFAKAVNETTRRELTDSLADGISAGDTIDELRQRVKSVYRRAEDVRAETIARSETKRALEGGRKASYESAGVQKMQWIADPNACEFCRPFDGKTFATSGDIVLAKGDSVSGDEGGSYTNTFEDVEHPPLHPRCTCFLVPVVE